MLFHERSGPPAPQPTGDFSFSPFALYFTNLMLGIGSFQIKLQMRMTENQTTLIHKWNVTMLHSTRHLPRAMQMHAINFHFLELQ